MVLSLQRARHSWGKGNKQQAEEWGIEVGLGRPMSHPGEVIFTAGYRNDSSPGGQEEMAV